MWGWLVLAKRTCSGPAVTRMDPELTLMLQNHLRECSLSVCSLADTMPYLDCQERR